ncbi:collagen-binding domain-containing protein [Planctomycetota bacterium]
MYAQHKSRRGSTLVLITLISVVVLILGLSMMQTSLMARRLAFRDARVIQARIAADAGQAMAMFQMNKKLAQEAVWDNSTLPSATNAILPGSMAKYSYTVTGTPATGFNILTTGEAGGLQRQSTAIISTYSIFQGIGTKEKVILSSADFDVIGPGKGNPQNFKVFSNAIDTDSIVLRPNVIFPGDIVVAPGGDIDAIVKGLDSAKILGEVYNAFLANDIPAIEAPTTYTTTVSSYADAYQEVVSGNVIVDTINLPNNGVLKITGSTNLYVTGPLVMNNNAEIIVAPGASLNLYLGDNLEGKNAGGIISEGQDATAVKIYGLPGCEEISLKSKTKTYAAILAPDADIKLNNGGDIYGSVIAKSFEIKNDGTFYFDTNLLKPNIDETEASFTLVRWARQ